MRDLRSQNQQRMGCNSSKQYENFNSPGVVDSKRKDPKTEAQPSRPQDRLTINDQFELEDAPVVEQAGDSKRNDGQNAANEEISVAQVQIEDRPPLGLEATESSPEISPQASRDLEREEIEQHNSVSTQSSSALAARRQISPPSLHVEPEWVEPSTLSEQHEAVKLMRTYFEEDRSTLANQPNSTRTPHKASRPASIALKRSLIDLYNNKKWSVSTPVDESNGDTLLHIAAREGKTDILHLLVELNEELSARGNDDLTLCQTVRELVNYPNFEGNTPLHLAIENNNFNTAIQLKSYGAIDTHTNALGSPARRGTRNNSCYGLAALNSATTHSQASTALRICDSYIVEEQLQHSQLFEAGQRAQKQLGHQWTQDLENQWRELLSRLEVSFIVVNDEDDGRGGSGSSAGGGTQESSGGVFGRVLRCV